MSHIIPPPENNPGQPSQSSNTNQERKWFNDQEIAKLKPIAKKFFKNQEDATENKIDGLLKTVEGYIKNGENLPPNLEKTKLIFVFRLALLGPEKWSLVFAEIDKGGIESLEQLDSLIQKEQLSQAPKKTSSTSLKRSHEAELTAPAAVEAQKQHESGFLEKKTKKEKEPSKGSEMLNPVPAVVKQETEIKSQPLSQATSSLAVHTKDEDFKKIFENFFTPDSKLRKYTWERLKEETQKLGSMNNCKNKSFEHQACWCYLTIQDQNKLHLLLKHLQTLPKVTPFFIVEAAIALQENSTEFADLVSGSLSASITDSKTISGIQNIYKKLKLSLDKQTNVIKIIKLFKNKSIFDNPKGLDFFELALSRILPWMGDEESFSFAFWVLECALKMSSSNPQTCAEVINAFFMKIEENQKELYITYIKSSPLDQEIYKSVIESQLLTTPLQEIKRFPQIAKEKFTPQSVEKMMSDSIFIKHLCEIADPKKAIEVTAKRLADSNLALSNGASVLMATKKDFISGLVEALQANIVYVLRLEKFARGEEKAPKWPVEKPNLSLRFPHLVNLPYIFKSKKNNSFIHQQSLKAPASIKKWNAIEFGLVSENQELKVIHCCPTEIL